MWDNIGLSPYLQNNSQSKIITFDDSLSVLRQAKIEQLKYLWGIRRPDSQRESQVSLEFPLVDDFKQCFPTKISGL